LAEPQLKNMLASSKYIKREILEDGIALLTFDRPDSTANIFDQPTFDELNEQLNFLETEKSLGGLIIRSAKPKIFIAGADLKAFTTDRNSARIAFLIEQGQKTFDRISRLPFVTVAAIHGVALGGGLEIALACDYRVASSDAATKLGLPETLLGILPAWGGSTRLPRLIGFQKALDAILTGRQFPAKLAARLGMVDGVAYPERIIGLAAGLIRKSNGKKRALKQFVVNRPPLSRFIRAEAEKSVLAKTRGNYPAQLKALEVIFAGLTLPHEQSLANEKDKFLELALGTEARNLIQLFFLQERAKKLKANLGESGILRVKNVRKSMVIGAGVMGAGIAQWLSARGIRVLLKDVDPSRLAKGMQSIDKLNREAVRRYIFSETEARNASDRIVPVYDEVPLRDIDLVIEAAIEELELKQKIFAALETKVSSEIVLASNTSALSIDAIAASLQHPERVVGIHFFNPVHRMQLVEIVHGPKTSAPTVEAAIQFVKSLGKLPVLVRDSPGFLVNRILLPYMVESLRLFREGHRLANIDRLMLDFGMPMGPLRLTDEVGFDVAAHVARELESRLPYLGPLDDTLDQMIGKGWLGRKSGKGFYQYAGGKESANPELGRFQAHEPTVQNEGDLRDRLVLIMVNEAARTLEEKAVEAPEDVDFGMIMGTGWAPFRGGPLHFADALGVATVVSRLNNLCERIGTRFAPCSLLSTMAEKGETFYPRDKGTEVTGKA
jgi:3-hydroxyacyl-CoA dehydrogenase / enoyl-CoA hydratase / 3-hydroxybutyryl-CoA epimerase